MVVGPGRNSCNSRYAYLISRSHDMWIPDHFGSAQEGTSGFLLILKLFRKIKGDLGNFKYCVVLATLR